jgi:hypothetical protein
MPGENGDEGYQNKTGDEHKNKSIIDPEVRRNDNRIEKRQQQHGHKCAGKNVEQVVLVLTSCALLLPVFDESFLFFA